MFIKGIYLPVYICFYSKKLITHEIMVQAKPTIENKTVTCPFCHKGQINVLYTSEHMSVHTAHAAGKSSRIPNYHGERYEVYSNCPECGKSKSDIKQVLETGTKPITEDEHKKRIERLKAAGFGTKLVTTRR